MKRIDNVLRVADLHVYNFGNMSYASLLWTTHEEPRTSIHLQDTLFRCHSVLSIINNIGIIQRFI